MYPVGMRQQDIEQMIVVAPDNEKSDTLTVDVGPGYCGHALKCEDEAGRVWYGRISADGKALLVREDLIDGDETEWQPSRQP